MTTHTPRWYFGWNIVAAATLLTLLTVGMRMSIGPFFLPMAQSLQLSRSDLSEIVAIGMLCYGLGMPLAGHLVGRWGTRPVLLMGTVIVGLSTWWTVIARDYISLLLAYGVLMSVGFSFTSPVALTPVISRWFVRRRGMALFFLSTGSMAGIAVLTPALNLSIERLGWTSTMAGFAMIFALLTIPVALFVIRENAPEHADQTAPLPAPSANASATPPTMALGAAFLSGPFWLIATGMFACGFSMNLIGTHGIPMLMDHGFDAMTSSLGIGLIGLVAIFSTLVLGRISDVVPRKYILGAIYFIRGLGFIALLVVGTHAELYGASVVGGLVWAGSIALSSAILADVYGVKLVGVLYGTAYLIHQIGAMISSWLGGYAFEAWGTHWIAFGGAALLLGIGALISLRLPHQR